METSQPGEIRKLWLPSDDPDSQDPANIIEVKAEKVEIQDIPIKHPIPVQATTDYRDALEYSRLFISSHYLLPISITDAARPLPLLYTPAGMLPLGAP